MTVGTSPRILDGTLRIRGRSVATLALAAAGLVLLTTVLRSAWICDDAYITLRTIDNVANGFGLTWNTVERVQTYTHPLWMMLLLPAYAVTGEAYYTVLAVSLLTTATAAFLLASRVAGSWVGALLALAILSCSKAFVDYSTSGLENPLTHLLLAALLAAYYGWAPGPRRTVTLALVTSLAAVNRMDSVLLFAPPLVAAVFERPGARSFRMLALGLAPFAAWELFSLFYYGFPFPNTAYAKLATGIPRLTLVTQGLHYYEASLRMDPLTPLVLLTALGGSVLARDPRDRPVAAGLLLYALYVLWIGGDFMSGRFLAAPVFIAAALVSRWCPGRFGWWAAAPLGALLLLGIAVPRSPLRAGPRYGPPVAMIHGVADERASYYKRTGLLRWRPDVALPNDPMKPRGLRARAEAPSVVIKGGTGIFGFYAGPHVHIIEKWAITDPLLARLPAAPGMWRIGHFTRALPEGYVDSRKQGRNLVHDPRIAELYDALVVVTQGPLLSRRRFLEIWKLNTGAYDVSAPDPAEAPRPPTSSTAPL